jgi:cell division protein FtsW
MQKFRSIFKGDVYIWAIVFILSVIGILTVYSSTGNLAFTKQEGNTEFFLMRHLGFMVAGLFIMYVVHNIPFKFYSKVSNVLLVISILLLLLTLFVGYKINNAQRVIPIFGFTFQPSDMAKVFLVMYIARYLSKKQDEVDDFKVFLRLILVILCVILPIIPENLSTALIILTTSTLLMFIGRIKIKFILALIFTGVLAGISFYGFLKFIDMNKFQHTRLPTWERRIDSFLGLDKSGDSNYQKTQAKIAIASGGIFGKGPGNSTQRNYLPHPYSDFIFAIIVEEYGLFGGLILLLCFIGLILRALKMVVESQRSLAALIVLGIAFSTSFQALVHMGVSVGKLPVTGLTLPLVSMGGTSILFNSVAFGIILGISRHIQEEKLQASTTGPGSIETEETSHEKGTEIA